MLYLAASCFQGLDQLTGLRHLLALAPDGLQLTPGWFPVTGFQGLLDRLRLPQRLHHGFAWNAYRQPVWRDGALLLEPDPQRPLSVHPPDGDDLGWMDALEGSDVAVEPLPPGHGLSSDRSLWEAMERRLWLAVDVAHLDLLERGGVDVGPLFAYERIAEIHLSASDGRGDVHDVLDPDGYGAGWARERGEEGVPRILECRMGRLSPAERARAVEGLR